MNFLIWILLIFGGVVFTWLCHAIRDLWRAQSENKKLSAKYNERGNEINALRTLKLQHERQIDALTKYAQSEVQRHIVNLERADSLLIRLFAKINELEGEKRVLENTVKHQFRTYFNGPKDPPKVA